MLFDFLIGYVRYWFLILYFEGQLFVVLQPVASELDTVA